MKRSISSLLVTIVCIGMISGSATLASADTATELQNQLKTVLEQINSLKAQLNATDVAGTSTGGCPKITRMLMRGARGSDVLALQSFLARDANIYPEGTISGFFGFATERAVQRFQERHGIAVGGDAGTTGYGLVGNRTRQAIANVCGGVTTGTPGTVSGTGSSAAQIVSFAFDQSSGTAPYEARLKLQMLDGACVSYEVDWGDRTTPTLFEAPKSTICGSGISERILQHTYLTAGTYTATLKAAKGAGSNLPTLMTRTIQIAKGEPYLRIEAPVGGSSVRLGDLTKIKWTTGNYPADAAIAFYAVGPSQTYSFAKRSMRTTEFDWIVGDGVCDGNSCTVQMNPGSYTIRAAMYTPSDGCVDFCGTDDKRASVVLVTESPAFTVSQLGVSGTSPIRVSSSTGMAPLAVNVHVEIPPTSVASNFEVDFGDKSQKYTVHIPIGETRSVIRDIAHVFTKVGDYTIQLRPVGSVQNVGSVQVAVRNPSFVVSPRDGTHAPSTAQTTFDVDTSCSIGNTNARRYTVDWGDATETSVYEFTPTRCAGDVPSAQQKEAHTLTHNYTAAGSFTVRYRASDGAYVYEASSGVHLTEPEVIVSPTFGLETLATTLSFKADESCSVTGAVQGKYTIDWGDGSAVTTYNPQRPACTTTHTSNLVDKTFNHTYSKVGNFTIRVTAGRSDMSQTIVKTKSVVVDTKVATYIWHRVVALISGTESVKEQTASVAQSVYNLFNPR